jgi:hypothetical protein
MVISNMFGSLHLDHFSLSYQQMNGFSTICFSPQNWQISSGSSHSSIISVAMHQNNRNRVCISIRIDKKPVDLNAESKSVYSSCCIIWKFSQVSFLLSRPFDHWLFSHSRERLSGHFREWVTMYIHVTWDTI